MYSKACKQLTSLSMVEVDIGEARVKYRSGACVVSEYGHHQYCAL